MDENLGGLDRQVEALKLSQQKLERQIALFRGKKEELKAIYDSSRAQLQVREAVTGISRDLNDVNSTIQRIETRIHEMQSRADAIDGLVSEGVLTEVFEVGGDDVDRQLAQIGRQQAIEAELARLKNGGQLPEPKHEENTPPMLEG
jgi:phage shock protein A